MHTFAARLARLKRAIRSSSGGQGDLERAMSAATDEELEAIGIAIDEGDMGEAGRMLEQASKRAGTTQTRADDAETTA